MKMHEDPNVRCFHDELHQFIRWFANMLSADFRNKTYEKAHSLFYWSSLRGANNAIQRVSQFLSVQHLMRNSAVSFIHLSIYDLREYLQCFKVWFFSLILWVDTNYRVGLLHDLSVIIYVNGFFIQGSRS